MKRLLIALGLLLTTSSAWAYEPVPLKATPNKLVQFRVWIAPRVENTNPATGYYKYCWIPLEDKFAVVLESPVMQPTTVNIAPPQGQPSIPTL